MGVNKPRKRRSQPTWEQTKQPLPARDLQFLRIAELLRRSRVALVAILVAIRALPAKRPNRRRSTRGAPSCTPVASATVSDSPPTPQSHNHRDPGRYGAVNTASETWWQDDYGELVPAEVAHDEPLRLRRPMFTVTPCIPGGHRLVGKDTRLNDTWLSSLFVPRFAICELG
jgi:hypothetical protein